MVNNDQGTVECGLCYQSCRLSQGQTGRCGVREADGGEVKSLVYGKLIAENVDPVEKKPLFHCVPGSLTYSLATPGCNFSCKHCQNSSISQVEGSLRSWIAGRGGLVTRPPEELVQRALERGCDSISYTYVEPTIFFEYAYDCARLAKKRGLGNIFVSNGYMSEQVLNALAPYMSALNIDLKAWSDSFYRNVCGARVAPVIANIEKCVELGLWVEVTTLLIPGMNDSKKELQQIAAFLARLDNNIPWHVTAFYPTYKMAALPPTSPESIEIACEIGRDAGLNYVYSGNVAGSQGTSTVCPGCSAILIGRHHFTLTHNNLQEGRCPSCQTQIAGTWSF